MPELPEVERAARLVDRAARGRRIERVRVLHPSLARGLPPRTARALVGRRIEQVQRRGKHQLLRLDDGSTLHVHFRMTGDWVTGRAGEPAEPYTRFALELDDGARIALVDPRALSAVALLTGADDPLSSLGVEPLDPAFTAERLRASLAKRRVAIKVALLDQRVVAGLGNIYAAESLWLARIDPRRAANTLGARRLSRLVEAIRVVLERASRRNGRYRSASSAGESFDELSGRFAVYDREGEPCPRCGRPVRRITQGARSTYFCAFCQRR